MNQSSIQVVHEVGRRLAVTSFSWSHEDVTERMCAAFSAVAGYLARHGVRITGPAVGCYEKAGDGFTVSAGFVVDDVVEGDETVHPLTLPPGDTITTMHVGPYERLGEAYDALQDFAAQHHLVLDQHLMWEEYHSEPDVDPELVMTRVTWPVTHANLGAPTPASVH
jgi:effector-binding domain-containing protein